MSKRIAVGAICGFPLVLGSLLAVLLVFHGHTKAVENGHEGHAHEASETPLSPEENDHPEEDDHGHDDHEDLVVLTPQQLTESGVRVEPAGPGTLAVQTVLRGEIRLDADRVAHVAPRIAGAVMEVHKNLGDRVEAGEVLAVLASRELAELKSALLAAKARQALAQATFEREKDLWKKQISAEQDYLNARGALEEARIAVESAEQQLHAVGLPQEYVSALTAQTSAVLTRYELKAPFAGEVIEKHIVLGEIFKDDVPAFIIANLDTVWADFSVYQKDLALVRVGQRVQLSEDGAKPEDPTGTISYIGPIMGQETRTATARVVLDNTDRRWLPGQYASARVAIDELPVGILIPKTALQTVDGKTCVFVQTSEGFSPTPVRAGRENQTHVEIVEGLEGGQAIVTEGAFVLKASLEKGALGHQH